MFNICLRKVALQLLLAMLIPNGVSAETTDDTNTLNDIAGDDNAGYEVYLTPESQWGGHAYLSPGHSLNDYTDLISGTETAGSHSPVIPGELYNF